MRNTFPMVALAFAACQAPVVVAQAPTVQATVPDAAPDPEPAKAGYSHVVFPTDSASCGDLEFRVIAAHWPDPQWVQAPQKLWLGGGWSSISTGRFGSQSWEHCETFGAVQDGGVEPIDRDGALGGLLQSSNDCRVPEGVLGDGRFFDFGSFYRVVESRDGEEARQQVGWKWYGQWEDYFYFEVMHLYSTQSKSWVEAGWVPDGFYPGWTHAVTGSGQLLLAGGYDEQTDGTRVAVDQTAVFDPATTAWSYVGRLNAARRDHVLLSDAKGAVAIGGAQTDGQPTESIERYDQSTGTWTELTATGPPFLSPLAARDDDVVWVAEQTRDEPGRFAKVDLASATWTWSATLPTVAQVGGTSTLISNVKGDDALLVTPDAVHRFDARHGLWRDCSVSRGIEARPIRGRGEGKWGPAHLDEAGRVMLTRIDRERFYDTDE